MSLKTYIKVYKNLMPDQVCEQTIEHLQNAKWKPEKFYSHRQDSYSFPSEALDITLDMMPNNEELVSVVWKAIENYIVKDFNFPWYSGWTGFCRPKYNRYTETQGMQFHCDHIHDLFDGQQKGVPILSVLSLLNNDFEGGEFIMFDNQVIEFNKGDVMVFPANFLYPHKVASVTKGTRYTAICWSW